MLLTTILMTICSVDVVVDNRITVDPLHTTRSVASSLDVYKNTVLKILSIVHCSLLIPARLDVATGRRETVFGLCK